MAVFEDLTPDSSAEWDVVNGDANAQSKGDETLCDDHGIVGEAERTVSIHDEIWSVVQGREVPSEDDDEVEAKVDGDRAEDDLRLAQGVLW